jgi:deoxyadenosine/deoxycytidine kinase
MNNGIDSIIIAIQGPIGAGKSTFCEIVVNKLQDCIKVDEPIGMWKELIDSDGKNVLDKFYSDIKRWAYFFQNIACITRMMKFEETIRGSKNKYIMLDRSLDTDAHVFEKMLHDSGMISEMEHQAYNLWCDFYWKYVRDRAQAKIINVYLKCDAKICIERIKKRGRVEEEGIQLDYLQSLNEYHDKWLLERNDTIVIDCNEDFESSDEKQNQMISFILSRIEEILGQKNNTGIESEIEPVIEPEIEPVIEPVIEPEIESIQDESSDNSNWIY